MDIFEERGIKIPNAVLIKEATKTETDDEVVDFLQQYGSILKFERIDDEPDSVFHQSIVVEYNSTAAVVALRPLLPYIYECDGDDVTYKILDLSTVCAHEVGRSQTKNYLSELQKVAKWTGQDFAVVLNGVMSLFGQSVTQLDPTATDVETSLDDGKPPSAVIVNLSTPALLSAATFGHSLGPASSDQSTEPRTRAQPDPTAQHASRSSLPAMSHANLNPPEVQRYVVEHIVKNSDSAMHPAQRLRTFSGRSPRTQTESDYDTWRSGVELLLQDPAVSDLQRSRRIFDSLLPPAADVIKHLKPDTPPTVYLQTLDSAYGTVQDGDELYAKFMDTFQDAGEKPSHYLQRLQVALNQAVKRGGVLNKDFDRHLLTQFCRGCWDNSLIIELQLKQRKHNPPSFAEFLLLLRTEEDRDAAKTIRMKQHLGSSRPRAATNMQYAYTDSAGKGEIAALTNITQQLAPQLADIQKQLANLTVVRSSSSQSTAFKPTPGHKWARLPKGLVRSCCTANIKISGEEFHCLLDTGSQVTTIPVSFYNQHFANQSVKPLRDLLQVEGAAGQVIPYLGYVEMVVTFPSEFLGVDLDVSTLALVVPDVGAHQSPVLIGMNTLEPLYNQYIGSEYTNFQPTGHGYKAVLKLLQIRHQQHQVGSNGVVRLASKAPILVPAGHTTLIDGSIHTSMLFPGQWALVEHPASPLPGGLCVKSSLIMLPSQPQEKITVILSNESDQDVTIPPLSTIAELAVSPQILSHTVSTSRSSSETSPTLKLDFGESPIPPEWKRRITEMLNNIPDVFAPSDMDFGCTDKPALINETSSLKEGDRVLVRNVRLRGKHKLEDKWEQDVYVVVKRVGDLPVYTVQPEDRADVPTRTLHRDLLLPCSFLPVCGHSDPAPVTPPRRPQTRSQNPASVDHTEDLFEEEDGWNVPEVQIKPATFQFQSSHVEPSSEYSTQSLSRTVGLPVFSEDAVCSDLEIVHLPVDGESSAESIASLPVGEEEPALGEAVSVTDGILPTCVLEILPVEGSVLPDQAETSPSQSEQLLSPSPISVTAPNLPDPVDESIPVARRSTRQRQPPNRLEYVALGNPLMTVVQTLFHGLVNAYSDAFSTAAVKSCVYDV
ncbi:paraneoplastic antigen Ma3-like [Solea senegalensis]|uniref:Paraneoplastic antigen Ma3-like n=1 Tax=Solea senegalensis TaxID=28829 RepID=A0AAV6PC25_SOLSE|nr:paraneoplastic antigen Ma3-like [Solea senegalensis]